MITNIQSFGVFSIRKIKEGLLILNSITKVRRRNNMKSAKFVSLQSLMIQLEISSILPPPPSLIDQKHLASETQTAKSLQ